MAPSPLSQVRLPRRYKALELLGAGGMGEVFRTLDRLSGQQVALKRVIPSEPLLPAVDTADNETGTLALSAPPLARSSASTLVTDDSEASKKAALLRQRRFAIANEWKTLASLRHPNIISVLDYGFDEEGSPFFTMELLTEPQPFTVAAAGRPVAEQVGMVGQLLAALSYLHRHGILHRDLKPSNVLCSGDRVKVLDFGVATHAASTRDVAGTLEYMAPELLLGDPPSPGSDLYALGVLLWETLTGAYPFACDSAVSFLGEVLGTSGVETLPAHIRPLLSRPRWAAAVGQPLVAPPLRTLSGDKLPAALREVVLRLLHRDPQTRYQSAEQVAQDLSAHSGLTLRGVLASAHESLLAAAPLVGRSTELGRLHELLGQAHKGHGSLLLLGGESGVGKSRLLDELRTLALVEGAQVVRGQAVSDGGSPLHELTEVLRLLSLGAELDDDSAAVLKDLVPDLPALLQRPIPDAPVLDSQAAQQRLLAAVEAVLLAVRVPTVLLLEDLHWAATETITLLQRIQPHLGTHPLLIVASYRDDERPELVRELPGGQLHTLRRLSAEAVAALAAAVLGPSGHDPELQRRLLRDSEGNALFLIEATRALAEDSAGRAGGTDVRLQALPVGVRALLKRRLSRVPLTEWPALKLAAVAGRQIDLTLLARLRPDTETFLTRCAEAGVLEVHEERWRFTHDKLREALLSELEPAETRQLHHTVATAIEEVYGDAGLQAAALAYHFDLAGVPGRALYHGVRAGEHALRRGALVEAAQLLQHATELLLRVPVSREQAAHTHRLLAQSLAGLGRTAACAKACQLGLRALGRALPPPTLGLVVGIVGELAGQLRRLLRPAGSPRRPPVDPRARREEAELLALVFEASFYSLEQLQMVYSLLGSTNAADDVGAVERQVLGYSGLALFLSMTPLRRGAAAYFTRAEALLRRCPQPEPRAELELRRIRALTYVGAGKLRAALRESELAIAGAARLRDDPLRMFSLLVRRMASMHLGDFVTALRDGTEIERLAHAGQNVQQLTWAQTINAMVRLRLGELGQARLDLAEASIHATEAQDQVARCAVDALRAQLLLRRGERARAAELVGPALLTLSRAKLAVPGILVCFRALLEVIWEMQQTEQQTEQPTEQPTEQQTELARRFAADLPQLVHRLGRYARANVIARPAAARWQGLLHEQQGDELAALRCLQQALIQAQKLEMPYDEAEAHEALGRLGLAATTAALRTALPEAAALWHLERSRELFAHLGVRWTIEEKS